MFLGLSVLQDRKQAAHLLDPLQSFKAPGTVSNQQPFEPTPQISLKDRRPIPMGPLKPLARNLQGPN